MSIVHLSVFIALFAFDVVAAAAPWDKILGQAKSSNAITFGVELQGPTPYSLNASDVFTPASNTKLFTTGAALEFLGPDFTFKTDVSWCRAPSDPATATRLTLVGSGDPSWTFSTIDMLADEIAARGVRVIDGPIEARPKDTRWNALAYPDGWEDSDRTECYGALAQAFNLNDNCATFVVTGPQSGRWSDASVPVAVEVDLKPARRTRLAIVPIGPSDQGATSYRITGSWAKGGRSRHIALPVHATDQWVVNLLSRALQRRGVALIDRPRSERSSETGIIGPCASSVEVTQFSKPLSEILKPFNKESLNLIGEALFQTLGEHFGDQRAADLIEAGQDVMRRYVERLGTRSARAMGLSEQPGYFSHEVTLFDGSGLSRSNVVSTSAMMALLLDLREAPWFEHVWSSLPIAGVDGTLARRMRGTAAAKVLRGKTGTLSGVYNLSGYVPRFGVNRQIVEYVPFVMLTKTDPSRVRTARRTEDRVGATLAATVNPFRKRALARDTDPR